MGKTAIGSKLWLVTHRGFDPFVKWRQALGIDPACRIGECKRTGNDALRMVRVTIVEYRFPYCISPLPFGVKPP